jgi:kinetochore protein Mis13/DSN1
MALLRPPSITRIGSPSSHKPQEQLPDQTHTQSLDEHSPVNAQSTTTEFADASLLHPSQWPLLASLKPPNTSIQPQKTNGEMPPTQPSSNLPPPISPAAVSSRLSQITSSLAPTLDTFASGLHDIELYRVSADNVSSKILHICSQRLEGRDAYNAQRIVDFEKAPDDSGGNIARDNKAKVRIRPERPRDVGLVLGALSRVERR